MAIDMNAHNPFSILDIWHWASFLCVPALWHAPGHCPFRMSFDDPLGAPQGGGRLKPVSLVVLYVISIDMKGNWMEIIKTGENENTRGPNST